MKLLLLYILIFVSIGSYSQEKEFLLRGKIIGLDERPIADSYVINNKNLRNNISDANGNFNIWVAHGDSLIVSHISYNRIRIYADTLTNNSTIYLTPLSRDIHEINVSPKYKNDYELARNNLSSVSKLKLIPFAKIKEDSNPVIDMAIRNNRLMRNEAESISILRFSFTQQIINSKKNIQRHKDSKHYSSTKKLK
jgi:hypothetical protein